MIFLFENICSDACRYVTAGAEKIYLLTGLKEKLLHFQKDTIVTSLVAVGWIAKNFIMETILCLELERFYIALNKVKDNSLSQLIKDQCLGKNV